MGFYYQHGHQAHCHYAWCRHAAEATRYTYNVQALSGLCPHVISGGGSAFAFFIFFGVGFSGESSIGGSAGPPR